MIAGFCKSRPQFSQGTAVVLFWTETAMWLVLSLPNSTRWGLPQERATFLRTSISPSRRRWRQHFLTHSASSISTRVRRLDRYQRRTSPNVPNHWQAKYCASDDNGQTRHILWDFSQSTDIVIAFGAPLLLPATSARPQDMQKSFVEFKDGKQTRTYDLRTIDVIQPGKFVIVETTLDDPDVMRFKLKVLDT